MNKNDVSFGNFINRWNEIQGLATPELHREIATWLSERWHGGERELVLLAFRNSGKSTLVGLFCAWLLLGDPDLRILVLAADLALARKMVRNAKRIIESHPLINGFKPEKADQWASAQFTVRRRAELRDPSMLAKGISANVTGSRADVVICDDVEVPNTCDTEPKREDLRQRLGEIDYVLVPGGTVIYIGTPHTHNSIYSGGPPGLGSGKWQGGGDEDGPFLGGFVRLELPVLDGEGKSRWPERFSAEKIDAIRRRTGPNKFAGQMMLRPRNLAEGRLDAERLRFYDHDLDYREGNNEATLALAAKRLLSASCWWDPAYGAPGRGDASVIAAVYTDADGDYWLHRVRYLEFDPKKTADVDEATQLCRQVAAFLDDLYLPSVILETNGLGRFLPGLLRGELKAAGVQAAVIEKASTRNKDLRILDAFDAPLAAGRLHAHRSVAATPFINEMREWRPGSNGRDDGLDAVSGCLLSEPVRLSRRPRADAKEVKSKASWRPGAKGFRADTDFPV